MVSDRYVGHFTDGFIEGKGTLSFHDDKFDVHKDNVLLLRNTLEAQNTTVSG